MIYDTFSDNFEVFMRSKLFILQTIEMLQIDKNEVNQIVNENRQGSKDPWQQFQFRPRPPWAFQTPSGPSPDGDVASRYGLPVTPVNPTSTRW